MLRTLWGDDERYKQAYWSEIPGFYFAGDGARRDERGYFWIMGRVDDVINVSGHRLGTAEIESALVSHESVAEAAVVGRPDELKGQAISAFVTLEGGRTGGDELKATAASTRHKRDRRARKARRHSLHRHAAKDAFRAKSCGACYARLATSGNDRGRCHYARRSFGARKTSRRRRIKIRWRVKQIFPLPTKDLAEAGREFYRRGWALGTSGNFSMLLARKPLRICVTASGTKRAISTRPTFSNSTTMPRYFRVLESLRRKR